MDIVTLKQDIENKTIKEDLVIFKITDNAFIPEQYINEISSILNKPIQYIDDLNTLNSYSLFNINNNIRVHRCDKISVANIKKEKYLYIITKSINKKVQEDLQEYIVEVPVLEEWQLKDFAYSMLEGIKTEDLDWLINICKKDIYRINNEICKIKQFNKQQQQQLFNELKREGNFTDLSEYNVFNLTNAVINKDVQKINSVLTEIKSIDAEPIGVVTLLAQGLEKLLQVWLAKNPTPETTGLKANVIYAIKNTPKVYTQQQLINCFIFISSIDKKLKTGTLCDMHNLIDYLICNILCI